MGTVPGPGSFREDHRDSRKRKLHVQESPADGKELHFPPSISFVFFFLVVLFLEENVIKAKLFS